MQRVWSRVVTTGRPKPRRAGCRCWKKMTKTWMTSCDPTTTGSPLSQLDHVVPTEHSDVEHRPRALVLAQVPAPVVVRVALLVVALLVVVASLRRAVRLLHQMHVASR